MAEDAGFGVAEDVDFQFFAGQVKIRAGRGNSFVQAASLEFFVLSFHYLSALPLSALAWAFSVARLVNHCWPMDSTLLTSQ